MGATSRTAPPIPTHNETLSFLSSQLDASGNRAMKVDRQKESWSMNDREDESCPTKLNTCSRLLGEQNLNFYFVNSLHFRFACIKGITILSNLERKTNTQNYLFKKLFVSRQGRTVRRQIISVNKVKDRVYIGLEGNVGFRLNMNDWL